MKFEEAITKMREGKKITHLSFDEDVYFMACKMQISLAPEIPAWDSIVKMKGDRQHSDMGLSIDDICYSGTMQVRDELMNPCKHGHSPQLELRLIMCNQWKVVEEE